MQPTRATIVREDAILRVATWEGVFFEVWRTQGTAADFRQLAVAQVTYAKALPDGKCAHVSIVGMANVTAVDAELRKAIEERSNAIEPRVSASLVVLPVHGFGASVIRAIITGLGIVSRRKVPMKVSASTQEGLAWLAPHLPARGSRRVTPAELQAVCASLMD